eukprot:CAMPEP_0202691736 /NCGR_PEP_ID=MMETSP1385-20130828/6372_1 /ASSEMBLY_ACC=CAM_ASM_000861 /TAXON_ID=933848 /ORGANISM="Elphidium margaritaceum" /LENGTH=104 /DNA_ID=CAMNT_0049347183 /DNA_START=93 /DNA_END=404 /DNA_ORIENTATION=+
MVRKRLRLLKPAELTEVTTIISPSAKSAEGITFLGFNIFGDKLATPIPPSRKKVISATTSSQDTQSAVSEFEFAAMDHSKTHLHHDANIVEIPSLPDNSADVAE